MELAGPITLSPTDQAELVLVLAVAALVVITLVAAGVAAIVGSVRRPARAGRYATSTAATVVVIGGLLTAGLVATIATGPDRTGPSATTPTTAARTPVTVLTPQHLAACDGTAWTDRVRHLVAAHGSPTLVRCTATYAVVDVDTIRGGPGHAALRSYWHLLPSGDWTTLAVDSSVGCGPVVSPDPAFPIELCQDLPAPLDSDDRSVVVPPAPTTTTA